MIADNIAEFMSAVSGKHFTKYDVGAIRDSIVAEASLRKKAGLKIKARTNAGKLEINERVARLASVKIGKHFTAEDVRYYKRLRAEEYQNRTGKCAWGFSHLRVRLGYDPVTGVEIADV